MVRLVPPLVGRILNCRVLLASTFLLLHERPRSELPHANVIYEDGFKITNKDKIYQEGQNYQKSFLMEVVYLRYILVVLATECTMFAVRYYCHITFKS